jgi:hypothetical protein
VTIEVKTGKGYVSYSGISTWQDCGWKFYLSRVQQIPEKGSWWLVGGNAVHTASEMFDKGEGTDPKTLFDEAWQVTCSRYITEGVDPTEFRTSGRKTREYPQGEDAAWWLANGPGMVQNWIDFRRTSGFSLVEIGGVPAIEVEVQAEVGGVMVRGFIDRVMQDPDGKLCALDLKSGSREPVSPIQLGIYRALLEANLGIVPERGYYWMARNGRASQFHDLTVYTPQTLASWVQGFSLAVANDVFIPHPSNLCGTCGVNQSCYVFGGSDASHFPPLSHDTNKENDHE